MAKMNVGTYLVGNISHKLLCDISESERGIITEQLIGSWEERKFLHPLPKHETRRSVNHFSAEYEYGLRKN